MPRPLPALTLGLGMLLTAATAQAATTVTIWSWTPVAPTMKEMIAQIEKAHPDIHVEATIQPHPAYSTALKAAQASGTMPDLVGLPAGAETQAYRADLQPLDDVAAASWGADWQKNFAPALLTQARLGNPKGDAHFYMLPQEAEVLNIWYDRAAFEKAGIKSPPTTFDELADDAAKLTKSGYIGFYMGGGATNFVNWVYMQIAAQTDLKDLLAAEEGTAVWDQPGMLDAAKIWQQLFTRHIFQPGALSALQYPTGANLFAAGRVGMISLGSWWLQETHLSTDERLTTMSGYGKFFFPPVKAGGAATPALGGIDFGWGMTKNAAKSPDVEAATKVVLKELISGVAEQVALDQLNDLPAFNGLKPTQTLNPHLQDLYDSYIKELATAEPHQIGNPVIFNTLAADLQAVGASTKTPEQAMADVQKATQAQASASN